MRVGDRLPPRYEPDARYQGHSSEQCTSDGANASVFFLKLKDEQGLPMGVLVPIIQKATARQDLSQSGTRIQAQTSDKVFALRKVLFLREDGQDEYLKITNKGTEESSNPCDAAS